MQVVYVGPEEQVVVPLQYGEIVATRGEPVDVPDEVAKGEPQRGKPVGERDPDDLEDFWPGTSGLLAQDGLWVRPQTKAAKAAQSEAPAVDKGGES